MTLVNVYLSPCGAAAVASSRDDSWAAFLTGNVRQNKLVPVIGMGDAKVAKGLSAGRRRC